jgi:hypothetical protein
MVDGGGVYEDLFLVVTGKRDGVLSTSVGKRRKESNHQIFEMTGTGSASSLRRGYGVVLGAGCL